MRCNRTCDTDARREKSVAGCVLKLCIFAGFLLCSDMAKGMICECPTCFLVTGQSYGKLSHRAGKSGKDKGRE